MFFGRGAGGVRDIQSNLKSEPKCTIIIFFDSHRIKANVNNDLFKIIKKEKRMALLNVLGTFKEKKIEWRVKFKVESKIKFHNIDLNKWL